MSRRPAGLMLILWLGLSASPAWAWEEQTSDIAHGAGSAICAEAGAHLVAALRREATVGWPARLIAGFGCLALGAVKEYVVDAEPSGRDLAADAVGVTLGLGFTVLW